MAGRGSRAWLLCLLTGIAATGGYFLLPSSTAQNVFIVLAEASVVAAISAGVLMHRPGHSLPWYLFASGVALILVGDVLWAIYESFLQAVPYPSVADALYFASAPLFVAVCC